MFDPKTFNPGLVNPRLHNWDMDGANSGDDFQHIWSNRGDAVEPGGIEGYEEPPWMPSFDINEGKAGYGPRENFGADAQPTAPSVNLKQPGGEGGPEAGQQPGGPPSSPQAAPAQPRSPSPMAGMVGLRPFKPLPQTPGSAVAPRMTNLYGSLGGLKGGGLGLPLDPQSNQISDPIEGLLAILKKGGM